MDVLHLHTNAFGIESSVSNFGCKTKETSQINFVIR